MAAKPDFMIPIAFIGIGLAVAIPRITRDGPLTGGDWICIVGGLSLATVVAVMLFRVLLKR